MRFLTLLAFSISRSKAPYDLRPKWRQNGHPHTTSFSTRMCVAVEPEVRRDVGALRVSVSKREPPRAGVAEEVGGDIEEFWGFPCFCLRALGVTNVVLQMAKVQMK